MEFEHNPRFFQYALLFTVGLFSFLDKGTMFALSHALKRFGESRGGDGR